jgi:ferrous iron transport protein A
MSETAREGGIKPLTEIAAGATVYFDHIDAGRTAKARMLSMGLRKGIPFKLASRSKNGPFVISLKGNRMVLGRGVTDKIMVSEEKPVI